MQALEHILYFADGEFGPTRAFRRAVALARHHGARLTLMDVTIESGFSADLVKRFGLGDDVQQSEQRYAALTHLAEDWVSSPSPRLRVTIGTPFIEVIQAVLRDGHDLVLKPARARPGRNLFASTDMHLLRKCPCPIWIDREPAQPETSDSGVSETAPRCRRILASIDAMQPAATRLNQRILDSAVAVKEQNDARLDIAHAFQPRFADLLPERAPERTGTSGDSHLTDAIAHLEQRHTLALQEAVNDYRQHINDENLHLLRGEPASQVLAQAEALHSDLIVLATLSRPREPGLFIGTTAEDLLQGAQTSVLALKPDGFVTPVQSVR
ncbi:MAG: universal stress protein [Gammaproteobacteria bacterium]|nr:universal stress protein [Gammaproteobacteria bacterium]